MRLVPLHDGLCFFFTYTYFQYVKKCSVFRIVDRYTILVGLPLNGFGHARQYPASQGMCSLYCCLALGRIAYSGGRRKLPQAEEVRRPRRAGVVDVVGRIRCL